MAYRLHEEFSLPECPVLEYNPKSPTTRTTHQEEYLIGQHVCSEEELPVMAMEQEEDETMLVQRSRGRSSRGRRERSRTRSPSPRRRRRSTRATREGKKGHWEWQSTRSTSWRTLPPWRRDEEDERWEDWTAGTSSGSGINRAAKAKFAPANPTPSSAPVITQVAVIPTLEQCGPTVRFWSDVCGITDSMNDSTNRSILAEESINSIVATLGNMNQMERAGLYVGLIQFMGILWADVMRAITIMENQDDAESFVQVQTRIVRRKSQTPVWQGDLGSLVQTFARTRPVTLFASKTLQVQAHFDSMEPEKAARISGYMQVKLPEWRQRWTLPTRSVSRDRVERFCAVLAVFEMDSFEETAQGEEAEWALNQWNLLEPYMAVDATDAAACETLPNETLPPTQVGGARSSGETLVRRTVDGPWEAASTEEAEELRRHDEDGEKEKLKQQAHDAWLWDKIQEQEREELKANRHQAWDDWAVKSEMDKNARTRAEAVFALLGRANQASPRDPS